MRRFFFKKCLQAGGQVASLLDWKNAARRVWFVFGRFGWEGLVPEISMKWRICQDGDLSPLPDKAGRTFKLKLSKPYEINNMRWGFALSRHSDILNLKTNPSVFHNRITCSWTRLWAITIEVQRVGQLCSNAWGLNLNAAFRVAVKYYVADFSVKERGYHQFRLAFLGRMVFR